MRQAQTRRNGWRWLALAVGTLSALSLAEASMARWPAGWQVSDLPAAQPGQAGAASASARSSCRQTAPRHW
ncbi:DUF4946 domain-containing protein [Pseudomonas aeruginosa]